MYSYQSRIRYSELDQKGYLKIESLLDYFQDCSTFHSEDLGVGIDYLKERHMVWVMSAWQIIVERYPVLGEKVTVGTAPYDFKGFMGFRNFLMTDESGRRLSAANTVWSLLDTDSGRPVRATEEMLRCYKLEPRLDMEYAPRRITLPQDGRPGEPVVIRPHHLDTNSHVNNGQYVKIALDGLGRECRVKQLRAEYKMQSYLNDVLIPWISVPEEGVSVVALKDKDEQVRCIVELKEG